MSRKTPIARKLRGILREADGEPRAMLAQYRSFALGRNGLAPMCSLTDWE